MKLDDIRRATGWVPLLPLDTNSPFARKIRIQENERILVRRALSIAVAAALAIALLAGIASADIGITITSPGHSVETVTLRKLGPTPALTASPSPQTPPTFTPRPPTNCTVLNRPLPGGSFGVDDVFLPEGAVHTYCLPMPRPARMFAADEYDQCLGTNLRMRLTPPPGARYSDGKPVPTLEARSSFRLGSGRHPAGYVPAGTYVVMLQGLPVGTNCSGNVSKYDLRWNFVE